MTETQPPNTIAAQIRQQLREVATTWIDDDGETDLVQLDHAIEIVDNILAQQPTVSYRMNIETR